MGGFNSAWFIAAAIGLVIGGYQLMPPRQRENLAYACIMFGCALFMIGVADLIINYVAQPEGKTQAKHLPVKSEVAVTKEQKPSSVPLSTTPSLSGDKGGTSVPPPVTAVGDASPAFVGFKSSPFLTPTRQTVITREIRLFYRYIRSLNFNPPADVPPITSCTGRGAAWSGRFPLKASASILLQEIAICEKDIDSPVAIHIAYGDYAFLRILGADQPHPDSFLRRLAGRVFAEYFSYRLANIAPNQKRDQGLIEYREWVEALLKIRDECGDAFSKKAIWYSAKIIKDGVDPGDDNETDRSFNPFFSQTLIDGGRIVDNQRAAKLLEIIQAKRLSTRR